MNGIPEVQMCEGALPVSPIIGIEKECTKCKKIKVIEDFYSNTDSKDGHCWWCKRCMNEKDKQWWKNNREKAYNANRRWRKNNPENVRRSILKWAKSHPDVVKRLHRRWIENNPEKVKEYNQKANAKKRRTLKGRLNARMSNAVYMALRSNKKGRHWETLVGYTLDQLKKHLEKQFKAGMTWENYGKGGWEIDHKIPQTAFNYEKPEDDDFKKCWALKNLQPLWAKENILKGNKIDRLFQPSLIFK